MGDSIVQEFQNLQVLAAYDFQNFQDVVEDMEAENCSKQKRGDSPLTHKEAQQVLALSSSRKQCKQKRKNKKKRPKSKTDNGNISPTSESSLEEALKDYFENVAMKNQSDSDDASASRRLQSLHLLNTAISLAESDSLAENSISPLRPHRRRRKCKRMAVDLEPYPPSGLASEIKLKDKWRAKHKLGISPADIQQHMEITLSQAVSGKRKRCPRDRRDNSIDNLDQIEADETTTPLQTSSSSSVDSSDHRDSEDTGLATNDEGRHGDDEQSDFYLEAGPACGIPGIIPWWESEKQDDDDSERDASFQKILNGSFEYLSPQSQKSFRDRITRILSSREVRAGRRRIKDRKPAYTVASYLRERHQWDRTAASQAGSANRDNTKRRRCRLKDDVTHQSNMQCLVGGDAEPIPASNVGNRLLQSMGWSPGTGLGPDCAGITNPILVYRRPYRRGLGSTGENAKK